MPIDIIFVGILESLAKDALKHGIREAIRAMAEQEILETDINRLVSQPFRSANAHLQNAMLELENASRQQEHIEYARLDFIKASDLDAPLPAARAAFYVGLCHRLRREPKHELLWYERSFSMLSEVETKLKAKLADVALSPIGKGLVKTAGWLPPSVAVGILTATPFAAIEAVSDLYGKKVAANLNTQIQTVRDHKNAVQVVIEAVKMRAPENELEAKDAVSGG